jgi:hypothetical protein
VRVQLLGRAGPGQVRGVVGLQGIEVDHQDHDAATRAELRGLGEQWDVIMTGSSDYHGTGKVDHDLGVNSTDPETYATLRSLMGQRAGAAGR